MAKVGFLMRYSETKGGISEVYIPATDKVVTSVHILTDENKPPRSEEYFSEIDALRVRTAPRPKTVNDYQHLVKTFYIDDEDGPLYKTTRVIERKGIIVVGCRSLVTAGRIHMNRRNMPGYTGTRDASSTTDGRSTSTIPEPESHQEQLVNHGIQGVLDAEKSLRVPDEDSSQREPERVLTQEVPDFSILLHNLTVQIPESIHRTYTQRA